jgi:DNA-binding NarL/FixJ family response regulator
MVDAALSGGRVHQVVGRVAERARIDDFVATVPDGARALTIRGESGIGKTVLWRHGIQRARDAGFRVLVTRPSDEDMSFALAGLSDLFEDAAANDGARGQEDALARGRAVLQTLRRLAAERPILVAVDDLQWLDAGSAQALRYALRRLDAEPVGVLATVQADPAGDDPLALSKSLPPGRTDMVEVGPLPIEELRQVLGGTVSAISRPTLRRIHEVSGGNPLYAIELARGLAAAGREGPQAAGLPLPQSLAGAIAVRLDAVAPELWPVLETVSALGRASIRAVAAPLEGDSVDTPTVERRIAAAERAGLLAIDDDLGVRYAHPMTATVVYGRIHPLARRDLHARLAEHATDPDVRARHLALSVDEPDSAVATLLEEASERARSRGASDVAAELARQSLRLTPAGDADGARRRSVAAIRHLAAAGETGRAVALADAMLAQAPSGPGRAATLVQRFYAESVDLEQGDRLLDRALEDAGEDELLRAQVLDILGWLRGMFRGDLRAGIECAREAAAIASRMDDPELQMLADGHLAHMEGLAGRPRWDLLERAVELSRRLGGPRLGGGPRAWFAKHLLWAGDLVAARAQMESVLAEHVSAGNELERPYRLYDLALLDWAEGDLAGAERWIDEGMEAARDAENSDAECWLLFPRGLVEAWTGRHEEARATAGLLMDWARRRAGRTWEFRSRAVMASVGLSAGDAQSAVAELTEGVRLMDEAGFAHPGYVQVLPDAVEALAWTGEVDAAVEMLERLDAQADALRMMWPSAAAERCRGVVQLAQGLAEEAEATLERVARRFERSGHRPDAARAILIRGRALMRAGHRTRAADAFADARARFAGMGASAWVDQVERELERVAPGRAAGTLTEREHAVAELVARGLRNREVGALLFMSEATVEAHLTRMYRKLGIRSRSELVRVMTASNGDSSPSEDRHAG